MRLRRNCCADKIFFRTGQHPVYEWLRGQGKHLVSFDKLYDTRWRNPGNIYEVIVAALFKKVALRGEAVYAVPGSPDGPEETTNLIRVRGAKEEAEVRVLPGVSFLDQVFAEIKFDFSMRLQVVLPLTHPQNLCFKRLGRKQRGAMFLARHRCRRERRLRYGA